MLPAVFRLFSLISTTIYATISEPVTSTPDLCIDKSPYCNLNDCAVRPGYSLQFCRRTCGQCGEFCQESIYVSCKEERKDECAQMLKDYCPMLCGLCTLGNQTTKKISKISKQSKPMKYKIFDKGLSTPLQSTTSTIKIDQTGVDESTKRSHKQLSYSLSRKRKKKTKKTSKKPISTPILPSETTTRFTSPPISTQTSPLNFARPERKLLGVTSTAITQPTSDDPIWEEQETSTLNNQEEMAWVHPTRVFPQIQAEIDQNEEAISDWAAGELMSGPTPHIVPFNPYFVPINAKLGFGDTSQWSNGLFSDDGEKEEHLPQPIPLSTYRPLQPQPIILESTPPNWTLFPMPKKIAARKQKALVKIPKPRPLTINAVDMNFLGSEEEEITEPTMVPTFTPSLNQGPEWRFSGVVPPYHFPEQENYLANPQDDANTATQIDGPVNPMLRKRIVSQPTEDESNYYLYPSRSVHRKYTSSPFVHVTESPSVSSIEVNPMKLTDLITLLGCRDRDPTTCSQISEDTCHSRPGYYLKLCPVKCRNCNGLLCYDSIKIDCAEVKKRGGCKLPLASEYCPRSCNLCPHTPAFMEGLSPCKDELDTCEPLATTGVCDHPYSQSALRIYCAKSFLMENQPPGQEKCFVSRDYTKGLAVQFETQMPEMLQGRIRDDDWLRTIRGINQKFTEAEKVCTDSVLETILGCCTCYINRLIAKTRYEKKLKEIDDQINRENDHIYMPSGVHILNPMYRGLRVIEITVEPLDKER
ncbi:unnamed protein product, partial [Mesorhabditis belari]|uniref:Ras modification protein ERF4 n=1 Tax=Mesorhabditis belari TaxID=2138241 RepID=A0AAF3FF12_9BILA